MSCDDHPESECTEALSNVFRFLDGELRDDADAKASVTASVTYTEIERHLGDCPPCEENYALAVERLDVVLTRAVERSCHRDRASAELLARVREQLELLRGQVTSER